MPFPFGQEGAKATSAVARIAVAFITASEGEPAADVREDLTLRVSLLVEDVSSTVALIASTLVWPVLLTLDESVGVASGPFN